MDRRVKIRLTAWGFLVFLCFAILLGQLWRLQVVQGERYRLKADQNRLRLLSIPAPRGVIYDRYGRILARNMPSFSVTIVPADLPTDEREREVTLRRLSALLGVPLDRIKEMVKEGMASPFHPVLVQRGVSREKAFFVAENHAKLPGVHLKVDPIRQYLTGELTAHIIGYVGPIPAEKEAEYREQGYDLSEDKAGLTGVEFTFEDQLRGRKGSKVVEVNAAGREIRTVGEPFPPQPGHSLILTLDLDLQRAAEEALREGMEKAGVTSGVVVAMNPQTGEILAMVSLPSYDNNLFARGISPEEYARLSSDPRRPLVNHAISGQYPPGSTFKIVPAVAALEEGLIDRRTSLECTGVISLPNKYFPDDPELAQPFYCWIHKLGRGHGYLNVVEGIAQSCDIFFYKLCGGYEDFPGLGLERLSKYARLFGLGEKTGIDLPGESRGLVPTAKWKRLNYGESWVTGDTYNIAIGQGFLLATPLQMLNATAAVANGGTLYRPQIVYEVRDAEGNVVRPFQPQVLRRIPVSPENLALVREGMRAAVTRGTAWRANLMGVSVAGKTGTAEYPGPRDEKGHLPTHAWFTAFAPYEDPEIALVVFVEGGGEGSTVAVPIAAQILRHYFGLPEPLPTPTPGPNAQPTAHGEAIPLG